MDRPLKNSTRTIVFCHRVVNDSWKRSFAYQCCELSFIRQVDSEEKAHLTKLLASDQKLMAAFEKYRAMHNKIDLIANIALGGLAEKTIAGLPDLCDRMLKNRIDNGVTIRDVLRLLRDHGLYKHMEDIPKQRTLQLSSLNHELRGDEFVFKRYRVLNF